MKQLLFTITLLSVSINMASASSPFRSLVISKNKTDISITKHVSKVQHSRYFYAKRASNQGNIQAKYDLAMMYALGNGVRKDTRKAFNLFHMAARKGHVGAKYCMGINFEKGLGVRPQYELARYWFKLAAKAGHPQAGKKLATINAMLQRKAHRTHYAMAR